MSESGFHRWKRLEWQAEKQATTVRKPNEEGLKKGEARRKIEELRELKQLEDEYSL